MNHEENRSCPFCAETIKSVAKVCPRCRQWLTIRSLRNPFVMLALHSIPVVVVWVLFATLLLKSSEQLGNPRPYYSEFPSAIKIVESRINWAELSDGPAVYITGILTNVSSMGWQELEFDCRFFDSQGTLVDAANGRGHLSIGPNDDSAFRVAIKPVASTNSYASYKISVSNARNAKNWF